MCHELRGAGKEIKSKLKHIHSIICMKFDMIEPHWMAYVVLFHTFNKENKWDNVHKY